MPGSFWVSFPLSFSLSQWPPNRVSQCFNVSPISSCGLRSRAFCFLPIHVSTPYTNEMSYLISRPLYPPLNPSRRYSPPFPFSSICTTIPLTSLLSRPQKLLSFTSLFVSPPSFVFSIRIPSSLSVAAISTFLFEILGTFVATAYSTFPLTLLFHGDGLGFLRGK